MGWSQLQRCILQSVKLEGLGPSKSLTSDGVTGFEVYPAGFQSCFGSVFHHCSPFPAFWDGHYVLGVCSLPCEFTGVTVRDWLGLQKRLWTFKRVETGRVWGLSELD